MQNEAELYHDIILDHAQNPRMGDLNSTLDPSMTISNDSCGDSSSVGLSHTKNKIHAIQAQTTGCSICMASSSMMTELIHDVAASKAHLYIENVRDLLTTGVVPQSLDHTDLGALAGVASYPARVKCAMLPWLVLEQALRSIGE